MFTLSIFFLLGAWKPSHLSKILEFKIQEAIFTDMRTVKTIQKELLLFLEVGMPSDEFLFWLLCLSKNWDGERMIMEPLLTLIHMRGKKIKRVP